MKTYPLADTRRIAPTFHWAVLGPWKRCVGEAHAANPASMEEGLHKGVTGILICGAWALIHWCQTSGLASLLLQTQVHERRFA